MIGKHFFETDFKFSAKKKIEQRIWELFKKELMISTGNNNNANN